MDIRPSEYWTKRVLDQMDIRPNGFRPNGNKPSGTARYRFPVPTTIEPYTSFDRAKLPGIFSYNSSGISYGL